MRAAKDRGDPRVSSRPVQRQPRRRSARFGCGVGAATLGYTVTFLLWYGAFFLPLEKQGWLEFTAVFGSWSYLPLWPLLGWALLQRQKRLLLLLALPLLLFTHNYGQLFLPRWPTLHAAGNSGVTVRVMSWNALYTNTEDVAFRTTLEALQPDIVAIQEFGYGLGLVTRQELAAQFPHQALYVAGDASGMAILSRYPIVRERVPDFRYGEGCNCQELVIEVAGQPITLLNAHPWPPRVRIAPSQLLATMMEFSTAYQDATFDALLARITTAPRPLLLVGDLNTSERQQNYLRVTALLTDAFRTAGWGFGYTFPAVEQIYGIPMVPLIRLDYIFHGEGWYAKRSWSGTIAGSDHRYIVADLLLLGTE